jgi:hypothetical protein
MRNIASLRYRVYSLVSLPGKFPALAPFHSWEELIPAPGRRITQTNLKKQSGNSGRGQFSLEQPGGLTAKMPRCTVMALGVLKSR